MAISQSEHPFAEFIKILGKGKKGSRPLTEDEAYRALAMILNKEVEDIQLGAFLMLMRVKEETPEELAGFVRAARESLLPQSIDCEVDLDWSSYAGKRRHLPWFLLATKLLVQNGTKVFMHGAAGHTEGRIYTDRVLDQIGLQKASTIDEAVDQINTNHFSYLSLQSICPILYEIINLRPIMGLRSPVHTLVRLLNPLSASHSIQGIFHPSYRQVHQKAALLLNQSSMAVLKGEGGETERNPDVDCLVQSVKNGDLIDEVWPKMFQKRHLKPDLLDPEHLRLVWEGEMFDEFAEATVIGTAAVALKMIGKAETQRQAHDLAKEMWQARLA